MIEFNAAAGLDNPTAAELRAAQSSIAYLGRPLLRQNRGMLANVVFRPRSSLLFSAEYCGCERLSYTMLAIVPSSST